MLQSRRQLYRLRIFDMNPCVAINTGLRSRQCWRCHQSPYINKYYL